MNPPLGIPGAISRLKPTRVEMLPLLALELAVGAGAFLGGRALIHDAEGFGVRDAWLRWGVFHDYTVPGAILIVAVGGGMTAAATLALARSRLTFRPRSQPA